MELEHFYREFDSVNHSIRENLLEIIDGDINLSTFSREKVSRDLDPRHMPNFGRVKQVMEKCKKYMKSVKNSIVHVENSIRYFSPEEEKTQA